jgi:hypothetical protein
MPIQESTIVSSLGVNEALTEEVSTLKTQILVIPLKAIHFGLSEIFAEFQGRRFSLLWRSPWRDSGW